MHTAQLELTQANLQKEKETALTELREMLNGRRAQELALLQSRQQCELELMREQHAREKEEMALRNEQETGTAHVYRLSFSGYSGVLFPTCCLISPFSSAKPLTSIKTALLIREVHSPSWLPPLFFHPTANSF